MITSQMRARQGEVWLARFPSTDLSTTKLRPVVAWVVFGKDAIVISVFSRVLTRSLRETWVLVEEETEGFARKGLTKTSVVKAEKLTIVHHSVLQRKLGDVPPSLMSRIETSLKKALHLE